MFIRKKHFDMIFEAMEAQNATLAENYTRLDAMYRNVMSGVDTGNSWNNIKDYESALALSHSLYNYGEDFGCGYYRKCINYRAKATMANGLEVNSVAGKDREVAFAKKFIKFNGLNFLLLNRIAVGAELEGKVLLILEDLDEAWNWESGSEVGIVRVNYLPYAEAKYTINQDSYGNPSSVDLGGNKIIEAGRFVYYRTDQPCSDLNKTNITCQSVFSECRGLEESSQNNRKQNNTFADPIYAALCADIQSAAAVNQNLEKIGSDGKIDLNEVRFMAIAGSDVKAIVPPDRADIGDEQQRLLRAISIKTGIPLTALNAADVHNKNVSESMSEIENTEFSKESDILAAAVTEAISKSMKLLNGKFTPYDTEDITISIGKIGNDDWNRAAMFWFPACSDGKISERTFHENVPGIDPELEASRLSEERKEAAEKVTENQQKIFETMSVEDDHEHE